MTLTMMEPKAVKSKAIKMPLTSLRDSLAKISPALIGATIPVLKSVKIEAGDDVTAFTATNLDLSIRVMTKGAPGGSGAFLMPSERLLSYAKLLDGDEVALTVGERKVTLKCGRATTQFSSNGLDAFPITKFGTDAAAFTLKQSDLLEMLHHTIFSVSEEANKYTLGGALLESAPGEVRIVATDGHRLAIFSMRGDYPERPSRVLPLDLMQALYKALADDDELTVSIGTVDDSVTCEVLSEPSVSLSHRMIAGNFPNYKAVVPTGPMGAVITVDVAAMLASLTRCVAMSDKKTTAVKMYFTAQQIVMKAVDGDAGETEEVIEVEADTFPAFTSGFNGHYLLDVMKRIDGEMCRFEFAKTQGQSALKITHTADNAGEFVYVVMPMRV